jgi:hypothetical protein
MYVENQQSFDHFFKNGGTIFISAAVPAAGIYSGLKLSSPCPTSTALQNSITKPIMALPPLLLLLGSIRVNPLCSLLCGALVIIVAVWPTIWNLFADGMTRDPLKNGLHILQRRSYGLCSVYGNSLWSFDRFIRRILRGIRCTKLL